MKNKVVITSPKGERFELKFRALRRELVVTCLQTTRKLDLISPVRDLMGTTKVPLIEEGIYSHIVYKCRSKKEFLKIVEDLGSKESTWKSAFLLI